MVNSSEASLLTTHTRTHTQSLLAITPRMLANAPLSRRSMRVKWSEPIQSYLSFTLLRTLRDSLLSLGLNSGPTILDVFAQQKRSGTRPRASHITGWSLRWEINQPYPGNQGSNTSSLEQNSTSRESRNGRRSSSEAPSNVCGSWNPDGLIQCLPSSSPSVNNMKMANRPYLCDWAIQAEHRKEPTKRYVDLIPTQADMSRCSLRTDAVYLGR